MVIITHRHKLLSNLVSCVNLFMCTFYLCKKTKVNNFFLCISDSLDSEACVYALSYDLSSSRLVTCEADRKLWSYGNRTRLRHQKPTELTSSHLENLGDTEGAPKSGSSGWHIETNCSSFLFFTSFKFVDYCGLVWTPLMGCFRCCLWENSMASYLP